MSYFTEHGSSGDRSERFAVYDEADDFIGCAYTVDRGEHWFINGLFAMPLSNPVFTDSRSAIDAVIARYESRKRLNQYVPF